MDNLIIKDAALEAVLYDNARLVLDGGFGSMLIARGVVGVDGVPTCVQTLRNPAEVTAVHRAYVQAGSQMILTASFCADARTLEGYAKVKEVFPAAVACARAANAPYVAADFGPLNDLLDPYGDIELDEAYDLYAEQVAAACAAGVDALYFETMTDLEMMKVALRAARDASRLPIFASMSFDARGFTLMGQSAADCAQALVAAGANAVGANCSVGPADMATSIAAMHAAVDRPLIAKPNAGAPRAVGNAVVYDVDVPSFARALAELEAAGARVVGGCCGTTPEYIAAIA